MFEQLFPFVPAIVWGITPVFYRKYLDKADPMRLNFLRDAICSAILVVPFLVFGFDRSVAFGALSGFLNLAIGDTMFFLSISLVGASIAAPLISTQTVIVQFLVSPLGEPLTPVHLISAALIVTGVYLLSKGKKGSARKTGIAAGIIAAVLSSSGQSALKVALTGHTNLLSLSFSRTVAAAVPLGIVLVVRKKSLKKFSFTTRDYFYFAIISIFDQIVGVWFFLSAIASSGVVFATIILGLSPLIAQVSARVFSKESPRPLDFFSAGIIVAAIILTVL